MKATGWQRSVVLALDRGIAGFSRHWLAALNLFFFTYVALPFVAPALMAANLRAPGEALYTLYSPMCHQLAYRSWFLFGEQAAYLAPEFQERTGIEPYSNQGRLQAKAFLGNEEMGYKVAFCERDVAIYIGILIGGLAFAAFRRRMPRLHWAVYVILGVVPMGLDGFSQVLSQPPFNALPLFGVLPFRESTPFLRTLTGGLFGLVGALYAYPYVDETMTDTQDMAEDKLQRARTRDASAPPA